MQLDTSSQSLLRIPIPSAARTLVRWIIAGSAALLSACTVDADPRAGVAASALDAVRNGRVTTRASSESAAVVSEDELAAVRIARWQAWDQRAQHLPDGYVLSVELGQPRPGRTFAVFTVVDGHTAVQSVVGDAPRALAVEAGSSPVVWFATGESPEHPHPGVVGDGSQSATLVEVGSSAIAWGMPLGEPPPKEPPPPGIVAQGSSLLAAAFAEPATAAAGPEYAAIGSTTPTLRTASTAQAPRPAGHTVPSPEVVDRVRAARRRAWDQLATTLPDGHVLSVELLRAPSNQAMAVFTVVQGHRVFQSVVGDLPADAVTAPTSPEIIALGEPPPKQPPPPGVAALGIALLSSAFGVAK